jgi:hypothetical protein
MPQYFLSIAETVTSNTLKNSDIIDVCNKANEYLIDVFKTTFPPINYDHVTTNEIGNIIDKLRMTNSISKY